MPIIKLPWKPGVQQDGTILDADAWVQGTMVRWYNGRPKTIGGRERFSADTANGTVNLRQISSYWNAGTGRIFLWPSDTVGTLGVTEIQYDTLTPDGTFALGTNNRTGTAWGTVNYTSLLWQDTSFSDTTIGSVLVIGHGPPNLLNIDSAVEVPAVYQHMGSSMVWATLGGTAPVVSGGVTALQNYVFLYGGEGYIAWSAPGDANDWTTASGGGAANVAPDKVVKGLPLRAGASGPSGLFWTLTRVIRATFDTDPDIVFRFTTMSDQSTILAANSVIGLDCGYFWIGNDRFWVYNGQVRENRNTFNKDWFFSNLNRTYANKICVLHQPQFNEIWWLFPLGAATDNNWALIYNYSEGFWFDTPYQPNAGAIPSITWPPQYRYPLFIDGVERVWQAEKGADEIVGTVTNAITKYVESGVVAAPIQQPAQDGENDRHTWLRWFEPDMEQAGTLVLEMYGRNYARSADGTVNRLNQAATYTILPTTERVIPDRQAREWRLGFRTSGTDASFFFGRNLMKIEPGDQSQANGQ